MSRKLWPYLLVLFLMAVGLGVSASPAPLYALYAARWDFGPIVTTVVFAVYALAALISVLISGSISDRFGRRPVLLAGVGFVLAGLVMFVAVAGTRNGVAGLIAGRMLHGFGVGAIVVAGAAALLDLRPDAGARAGMHTGVAFNVGISIVVFLVAVVAQAGLAPLITPYVALAVLLVLGALAMTVMPESHGAARSARLHVARPRVPAGIRPDFRFAALGVMASWSVLGVFLSLYPTIASQSAGTTNLVFAGSVVALSAAAAAASQLVGARFEARRAAIAGDLGMAVFLLACIGAVALGNPAVLLASSVALGLFFGLAFGASLRYLGEVVPEQTRGEVMSAFYVLAYGALALPTIAAGWAATTWGPARIFAPFMVCVASACVVAAVLGTRINDTTGPEPELTASEGSCTQGPGLRTQN